MFYNNRTSNNLPKDHKINTFYKKMTQYIIVCWNLLYFFHLEQQGKTKHNRYHFDPYINL